MRTEPPRPTRSNRPRPAAAAPRGGAGFTLVELLVVAAIIAVIAGALAAVLGGMGSTARVAKTKTLIEKINGLLDARMQAFEQLDLRRQIQAQENLLLGLGLSQADATKLAPTIVRKELFRQYFPQRFAETGGAMTAGPTHNPAGESSEVLYRMLMTGDVLGAPVVGDGGFTANEVMDLDKDGYAEFVDAWGQPLRFYRWPTRLVRIQGVLGNGPPAVMDTVEKQTLSGALSLADLLMPTLPTEMLAQDPGDPLDLLATVGPIQRGYTASGFEQNYHTPQTYALPLVVSAGADNTLGLFEPIDTANFGHLAKPAITANPVSDPVGYAAQYARVKNELNDNLTNRQARGGK